MFLFLVICVVAFFVIRAAIKDGETNAGPERADTPPRDINLNNFRITISSEPEETYQNLVKDGDRFWQPAGKSTRIREFEIPGMVYVGQNLSCSDGYSMEPALINPNLPVGKNITECSIRRMNYWPSYRSASPDARASYLYWHSTGRKDPGADIGYVFLYFYGLERRILTDAKTSATAKSEIPIIQAELERLLSIYSGNRSFQGYAGELLNFLKLHNNPQKLYQSAPPPLTAWNQLTFQHGLGLAQCAEDGKPLPAEWAYVWLTGNPNYHARTPAVRCKKEFKKLFLDLYRKEFGEGLVLQKNKTKLKLQYRPASSGLVGGNVMVETALPDVSLLSGPVKKFQGIADECCEKLESYSRYLGKTKEKANTFRAELKLPYSAWPDKNRKAVESLKDLLLTANGMTEIPFKKILELFPEWTELDKDTIVDFECALADAGIGIETGLNIGGGIPSEKSTAVIFSGEPKDLIREVTPRYQMTSLTMHLGVAVAATDSEIEKSEEEILKRQVVHQPLAEPQKKRLHAHLRMLIAEPPKLTGLTKRIAALKKEEKEYIGNSMALVALADSAVDAAEMKTLEKVFKLLGIETKQLYSLIHSSATEPITVRPAKAGQEGYALPKPAAKPGSTFRLDPKKIAALQAESERVAALLAPVFESEPTITPKPAPAAEPEETTPKPESLVPGLELEYSDFARSLFSRTEWSRVELEELAQDRGLPLDGVMERVNDAFYDKYEQSLLIEAGTNIEVNQEILREVVK